MYNQKKYQAGFKDLAKKAILLAVFMLVFSVVCPQKSFSQSVPKAADSDWSFFEGDTAKPYEDVIVTLPEEKNALARESSTIVEAVKSAAKSWWERIKAVGRAVVGVVKTVAQAFGVVWQSECKDIRQLTDMYETCNICEIFTSLFYGVSYVAQEVYNTVAKSAVKFLAAFASLWLALEVLKAVASITPIDSGEFFKKIGTIAFKVGIISLALMGGPAFVFGNIIGPLIEGGTNFALVILGADSSYCDSIPASASGALPVGVHRSLRCLFQGIYESIYRGFVFGHALCCYSTNQGYAGNVVSLGSLTLGTNALRLFGGRLTLSIGPATVIPDFSLLLSGIIFYVFAFLVVLILPFYLIDSILKLGIAVFMMPVLMVAWVFPMTEWFAKKGFDMILSCILMFVMTAMVVSVNLLLIDAAVSLQDFTFEELYDLLDRGKDKDALDQIKKFFDFTGLNVLAFIAAHLWAFLMFGKIGQLSGHFAQTVGGGFSNKVGGIAFKTAKKTAVAAYVGAKSLATPGGNPAERGKEMAESAKKTVQSARKFSENVNNQMKDTSKAAQSSAKAVGKAGAEIGKAGAQAGAETGKNIGSSSKTAASGAKFFGVGLLVTVPLAAVQFTAQQSVTTAKFAVKTAAALAKASAKIAAAAAKLAMKTTVNTTKATINAGKTVKNGIKTARDAPSSLRSKSWRERKNKNNKLRA